MPATDKTKCRGDRRAASLTCYLGIELDPKYRDRASQLIAEGETQRYDITTLCQLGRWLGDANE
jgi:hypothetical protein